MNETYELHTLCQVPKEDCIAQIQLCLDAGADINLIDNKHETALSYAIKARRLDVVRYLLENKANPNLSTPDAFPSLVWAAIMDSKDSIKFTSTLLEYPDTDINQYGMSQVTALYTAAEIGNAELVAFLIENGAISTNALINNNVYSPLLTAICNQHSLIAVKLLHHFPKLMNQKGTLWNIYPLHQAAVMGLTDVVVVLLDEGADIDALWREEKVTPLYLAAQNGYDELVLKLIKRGADYKKTERRDLIGKRIIPLHTAGVHGHVNVVELLLNYSHTPNELTNVLNSVFGAMMQCRDYELRQKIHRCSELIKNEITKFPVPKILTLDDDVASDWEQSFTTLFSKKACNEDKFPSDKDSAIRYVLSSMYGLLENPKSCIPYVQHLSSELEQHWQQEHEGQSFPTFDVTSIEFWAHQGHLWPIPKEVNYQCIKKFSLLDSLLLDKLKQYGMGEEQSKWTGFIPEDKSNPLLLNNAFFTENRRTINGLFHGNMHNIQRVILLLAMEAGDIPLTYTMEDGQTAKLEPKEVFSALVRTDIFFSKQQAVLWVKLMDSASEYSVSFTAPHCLHSLLLTHNAFSGTLQNYMLFSFCNNFIKMRQLYNHVYGTEYTNKTMCHELSKLKLELFTGLPEFAIQMDEKKVLTEVKKIDAVQENEAEEWSILAKHHKPLKKPTVRYSPYLQKPFCLFNTKKSVEQEQSNDMLPSSTLSAF
jgi:ankyrin repeat protein